MKQLFIFLVVCASLFAGQHLAAQGKNNNFENKEKMDTIVQAILGSQTSSGSECGHYRSSGPKPVFRVVITDVFGDKPFHRGAATPVSYQANVRTDIIKPHKKTQNFTFKKLGNGKKGSVWAIDVPCSVEEATFTIDLRQKKNGKIQPLNLNSKGNKTQLKLSVDFTKGKIYNLNEGKSLLGGFNKKLAASGKKMGNAEKGALKISVE